MSEEEKAKDQDNQNNIIKNNSTKSDANQNNQIKKDSNNNLNQEEFKNVNVYKIKSNSFKKSRNSNISSEREDISSHPMNLNINSISKNKRRNKSKLGSMLLNNLSNESDNKEQNKVQERLTCRQRLTRFLEISNRLFYIKLFICILSILSFIYYIICTYINSLYPSLNYIDFFICTIYIIEHLINIILSHHFFTYIISIESLILFLVELPPLFVFLCENYDIDLIYRTINMTRVLRLLKAYKIIELFQGEEKSVYSQIIYIIITLIIMLLIWAGIIQMSDLGYVTRQLSITYESLARHNLSLRVQFHHYIYFSLVSLTTVGYGEIIPDTVLGKFMIVLMVVIILVVVPEQTNEIISLSNAQTIYERRNYISSPDIPYVVILGDIDLESLKGFCKEYFHKDHGERYRHIVILRNKVPNENIVKFLNKKNNSKFIIYLQGDPMNKEDLLRADILNAKSCIIFTNKNSLVKYNGDQQALLLAIFIKKFYYHNTLENYFKENKFIPSNKKELKKKINNIFKKEKNAYFRICLQINRPESCEFYYSTLQKHYQRNMLGDKLLVIESLKMNLLSKSCLTPGIISLISNLVISSSSDKEDLFKNEPDWLKEYKEGQQYEIYKYKNIHGDLLNFTFQSLANEIYNKFHSILIALEINYKGGVLVKLNPQSKEKIIDIIYYSIFMDSKLNSLCEEINNKDDLPNSSLLGDYQKDSDTELEENTIKKNIDLKEVRISVYCISSNREIISDIRKLDEKKKINVQNNNKINFSSKNINLKYAQTLQSSNKDLRYGRTGTVFNSLKNNRNSNHKISLVRNNFSDTDSEYSDENEGNETKKYLLDTNFSFNKFEEDNLYKNYYLINQNDNNYVFTNEITRQGINDRNDIRHHIIICGMHEELINFILPLRSKSLPEKLLKWIVILSPILPQEIHETLCKFPKIIYIKGDPLIPDNLYRANIVSADIAVILSSSSYSFILKNNDGESKETIEQDNNNNNISQTIENNKGVLNEEIIDAKTLFIYKAIKNANKSIQIITELLQTNDIEFLLSSQYIKKLYKKAIFKKEINEKIQSHINDDEENNMENYELTPIFAEGQVYLPSLVDKITAQIFYNSNLLSILNLLLIGEKEPEKEADKKLAKMIDIKGTNLFLIPSEPRNESFGDMFNRLLYKYNMISIALYRKNVNENFYYVYINPKETTLIRDTDLIFVLSSKENIINIYEKNLEEIPFSKYEIPIKQNENTNDSPNFFQTLIDGVLNQIDNTNEDKKKEKSNIKNIKNNNESKDSSLNVYNSLKKKTSKTNLKTKGKSEEKKKNVKFFELDQMQDKLDKSKTILATINNKSKEIKKNVDTFVKQEIVNEIMVYISKSDMKK